MVGLIPVILGLLSAGGDEVLWTCAQVLLHQHPMVPCLPGVHPLFDPPTDCLGCGDMTGTFQDYRLKDNEPLRFSQSVLYPDQLFHQGHHEVFPNLPDWRVVALWGNDRKVTPPPLPKLNVPDDTMKVSARVGTNPFPVEPLESEVLWGQGVTWQITLPPLPVLLIRRLVANAPSFRYSGICSMRRNVVVTARSFPFPFPSCPCPFLTPLCASAPPPSLPRTRMFLVLSLFFLFHVPSGLGSNIGTLSQTSAWNADTVSLLALASRSLACRSGPTFVILG